MIIDITVGKEMEDDILKLVMRILNYWHTHPDKKVKELFRMFNICIDDATGKYHRR